MDDMLRELYQEVILDHGKNPRNFRHPEDATCEAQGNENAGQCDLVPVLFTRVSYAGESS